ncbi:MAG: Glu-tRNA(Gln) amidotransferase subunit GatD [Methanoregula sp.]|jgi:glutamyl-tRNA(Gln) amidotransferase subunit D|uniref:Glu-tRNA(Gln) amidotransferase subunit GatD n=1 Tax=Methanoregula sp. TaxID=2052170 RepID=UPI003C74176A
MFSAGDLVSCTYGGKSHSGTYITDRDGMAVVKLSSGYNIGVEKASCTLVSPAPASSPHAAPVRQDPKLPELSIISTGGTIASRIDYRTGAVTSQFDADDILTAIPALAEIGRYRTKVLYTILSENMTPAIWQELAKAVYDEIKHGVTGVIVTHGTDTMAYSAAALSFMLDTPVPVIFVGSQRSADRPSSDNAMNGVCAAVAAESDLGEVAVVMHATTNDDTCAIHRGTRVRKMHTSRRDAFRSIGIPPVGTVDYSTRAVTLTDAAVRRGTRKLALHDKLEPHCALIQFYPGMSPDLLKAYAGYKGLVLSGTGLGHVSTALIPPIKKLIADGTQVVMTSQCMNGRVCDRVYDTGRDLLAAGVIEGGDMLPEVALVKQMWVLGNERDPEKAAALMTTDLKGECMRRSAHGL